METFNLSNKVYKLVIFTLLFTTVLTRKHTQIFKDDARRQITLTTFGFETGGYFFVNINRTLIVGADDRNTNFGFTLDKSLTNGASPLLDDQSNECHLNKSGWNSGNTSVVYFVIDFSRNLLLIERSGDLKHLNITLEQPIVDQTRNGTARYRRSEDVFSDSYLLDTPKRRFRRRLPEPVTTAPDPTQTVVMSTPGKNAQNLVTSLPIKVDASSMMISFQFMVHITRAEEEGLYNFIFHNCLGRHINMTTFLEERNPGSYLSVGQQPMPLLFFLFFLVYIAVGCFWMWLLCTSKEGVFKIHYLMLALMYIKALAMLFHGINYRFISIEGHEEEAFAVLYYIMYLIKGIFMFVTIVLIGAGWTFVKHVLSDRDKKIFVVIIPLQILANVATIIIEESDEGMMYYLMWKNVFLVIDLICCGAILFPVIWSIRHLQQASQTDGKAAINLQKLKIFRHFYILVVCYIYFTRIIVLLVRIAVRFQYEWLDPLFVELATLAFFILTGYKFRPASNNPYLQLSQSDDEEEMDEVVTKNGALESITKVNSKSRMMTTEAGETIKQRESSHEYD